MELKTKYIEGWRVFLRWIWFSFILVIVEFPVRLIITKLIQNEVLPATPYTFPLVLLVIIILFYPFALYYISGWTGEFIAPRDKRRSARSKNKKSNQRLEPTRANDN